MKRSTMLGKLEVWFILENIPYLSSLEKAEAMLEFIEDCGMNPPFHKSMKNMVAWGQNLWEDEINEISNERFRMKS